MKLINPERLIETKGFFIEDECGCIMCVVSAQDIRNAPAVDLNAVVCITPGHTDQHNISEMAYNNGYAKGCEDTEKKCTALKKELEFTRKFIHSHGLEFALASEYDKAEKQGHWIIRSYGQGANAPNWAECSECHVCGSPQWKVCPVCEARMVETSGK